MLASDILTRVQRIVLDETSVRWPLAELLLWLNDGQREIALQKPSSFSSNRVISLVAGTYQAIPDDAITLLRVIRNIRSNVGGVRLGGSAITMVARSILDTQNRNWHDSTKVRQKKEVQHVAFDEADTRSFYVYPGNDGTGLLEMVFSIEPAEINITEGADPDDIASYDLPLSMQEIYANALTDYVSYRAYSKDADFAGNAQRAAMHYQQFANSLGIKVNQEMLNSPNMAAGIKATGPGA